MNMYRFLSVLLGFVCAQQGFSVPITEEEEEKVRKLERILPELGQHFVYSRKESLSKQAVIKAQEVMDKIKNHPYNVELAKGTLSYKKFSYYLEQDTVFLAKTGKMMAVLASKMPFKYRNLFLEVAQDPEYQSVVHGAEGMFKKFTDPKSKGEFVPDSRTTLALHSYVDFLSSVVSHEPIEVAVAAFTPCPWVYATLANYLKEQADPQTPFYGWIERFSSGGLTYTKKMFDIFDELADNASDEVRSRMVEAFVKGVILEYRLWDDAYHGRSFFPE
jgi:thiaminase/transcriptional activator TenA